MTGASLGVAVIGKSLAQARGLLPKHAVKQVDRLLSNPRIEARLCQLGSGNGRSPQGHRGGNGLDRL